MFLFIGLGYTDETADINQRRSAISLRMCLSLSLSSTAELLGGAASADRLLRLHTRLRPHDDVVRRLYDDDTGRRSRDDDLLPADVKLLPHTVQLVGVDVRRLPRRQHGRRPANRTRLCLSAGVRVRDRRRDRQHVLYTEVVVHLHVRQPTVQRKYGTRRARGFIFPGFRTRQ